jgi:hypothetical protein
MDTPTGAGPHALSAAKRGWTEAAATRPAKTAVRCLQCGASYLVPVTPRIVQAVRGRARCGRKALVIAGLTPLPRGS